VEIQIEGRVETGSSINPGSPRKPARAAMTDRPAPSSIDGAHRDPVESEKTMLTNAVIVNGLVLFAVLESDLGPARKLSRFRLLRPLLLSPSIVPMFLEAIGAVHWFNHPLATWMANHQLTSAAITDTLIIMAVATATSWGRSGIAS
jgi:hypothetical protein